MNAVEATIPYEDHNLLDREAVLRRDRQYWQLRRMQDVILSVSALLVLWPGMLIVALIIVIDSPGASPVFCQTRIGRDGKPFTFFAAHRETWAVETDYVYPGAIQYFGPSEVCDTTTVTLALEKA